MQYLCHETQSSHGFFFFLLLLHFFPFNMGMASSSGILPFMAIKNYYRCACCVLRPTHMKRYRKMGDRKRATCLATLLQNKLNSDVTRFTTHIKPVLQQIRLLTGLNVSGKTRNIAIQLVLQQCCKTSCTFFAARFSVP